MLECEQHDEVSENCTMLSLNYLRLVCINPSITSHTQKQDINRKLNDSKFNTNITCNGNLTDSEFNTNTTLQLCAVVDSYYLVKAVDTTSNIYYTLETIANNTVQYWVSLMLLSIMCIFHKDTFTMYVSLTNQLIST